MQGHVAETQVLALLAKQRSEIRDLLMASPSAEQVPPRSLDNGGTGGEGEGPEHVIILAHGLAGTPRDVGYVKQAIEGRIHFP